MIAMRRAALPAILAVFFPLVMSALPPQTDGAPMRHFILESSAPIDAAASEALRAEGIDVQRPLANHRYLVRIRDGATLPSDARVRSLTAYDGSRKIARAAYAEAAQGKAFVRLAVVFHDEVTFDEAQQAIENAGGTIDTPLDAALRHPQRLTVRIPSMAVTTLAENERVFGVYGPPRRPRALNAVAAQVSHVTPLFSAPYNLDGSGVVLTISDIGGVDASHQEFGGRVTTHGSAAAQKHPTHVAGTMIAAGVNPRAKGMAPAATLHAFDVSDDSIDVPTLVTDRVMTTGTVADNNSWDYGFSWQQNVWWGDPEGLGGYDFVYSAPYDAVMRTRNAPLIIHAAGNDGDQGQPALQAPWFPHKHENFHSVFGGAYSGTFCYSQNGSGLDCPAPVCSVGKTSDEDAFPYCEKVQHPTHTEWGTVGLLASTKNSLAVGATNADGESIASFSSRGPTHDGRIKPEVVAKGAYQFSTIPGNSYTDGTTCSSCPGFGTSMAAPVASGIAGLVTQQYRRTFSGATPSAAMLKTLLIAGADDRGLPGPDYTYGFGLVNAQASVDLVRGDNGSGTRIRSGAVANGQDIDIPVSLAAAQNFRVVLGWFDPEVLLVPDPAIPDDDPLAEKTLVDDLDLRVVDPTGRTVLPYVLNKDNPTAAATRAANHIDTTEMVEIANAVPGTYHVIIHGAIGDSRLTAQDYVLVMNGGQLPAQPPSVPRHRATHH
jgi:hypothetical protein